MIHRNNISPIDFSYLAVLLLLAYVMTSAPKYVRSFREHHNNIKIENVSPVRQMIRITKFYGVEPYVRTFNRIMPALSTKNLAELR